MKFKNGSIIKDNYSNAAYKLSDHMAFRGLYTSSFLKYEWEFILVTDIFVEDVSENTLFTKIKYFFQQLFKK